jgi:SAM-dependent methyltransferase
MARYVEEIARSYEEWLQSPLGYYIDRRKKEFILELLKPLEGERMLDLACGTGHNLLFFRRKGCNVTGLDSSPKLLDISRERLGERADLHLGTFEDLPFSDNEFDIVTLTSLEHIDTPKAALEEALRVCKGRIFIGACNRYSLTSMYGRRKGKYCPPFVDHSNLSSILELNRIAQSILSDAPRKWGSIIFFPLNWYTFASGIEEKIPVMKNPFGFFIGLVFPVLFSLRTLQDPLKGTTGLKVAGGHHAPVPREGLK